MLVSRGGGLLQENQTGLIELKWLDSTVNGRIIKNKIRLPSDLIWQLSIQRILNLASELYTTGNVSSDLFMSLERYLSSLKIADDKGILSPFFVTEYQRDRYIEAINDQSPNVITVDKNIRFYEVVPSLDFPHFSFENLESMAGCVVEYKESCDNIKLRWQLYRSLVQANATRLYGKKGEALNSLKKKYATEAPPLKNELRGYEIEGKIDLQSDLETISRFILQLYQYFDQEKSLFNINPHFRHITSQSAMATYAQDFSDPEREGKVLVGVLGAKFSSKKFIKLSDRGIIIRMEDKEQPRTEFNRQKIRELLQGMKVVGKTERIRRAFYLSSSKSDRVYKISVDFNWKLPVFEDNFFSQLEIEYAGVPFSRYQGDIGIGSDKVNEIEQEIAQLIDTILQLCRIYTIPAFTGRRKVDTFHLPLRQGV